MKFHREYREHLRKEGYPPEWVESAISYGWLKKCVKRVEAELRSLGLDAAVLNRLLRKRERQSGEDKGGDHRPVRYEDPHAAAGQQEGVSETSNLLFRPKLVFAVDEETGEPADATKSLEMKNFLHKLANQEDLMVVHITEKGFHEPHSLLPHHFTPETCRPLRLLEVRLSSIAEFFDILQTGLLGLAELQSREQQKLSCDISTLGSIMVKLAEPEDNKAKHDLTTWQQVFELYLNSTGLFSASEQYCMARDARSLQEQFTRFLEKATKEGLLTKFKKKESLVALQKFVEINYVLLQIVTFQEINQTAIHKILKKFDKHTGLHIEAAFLAETHPSILSHSFLESVTALVSREILSVVPQLDDYLCPVCFNIAYRPVRLQCQHLFCIRCLIIMQRERNDNCPLCRREGVSSVNSANLDASLAHFLKNYFPKEVKIKQKENERAAAMDRFGALYDARCTLM